MPGRPEAGAPSVILIRGSPTRIGNRRPDMRMPFIPRFLSVNRAALAACVVLALGLTACRDKDEAVAPPPAAQTTPPPAPPAPELKDVSEHDPRYVVGISFPPEAKQYPGLASALQRYADGARADLQKAVQAADPAKQSSPYDLTLNFSMLVRMPELVAVAADGSSYTGGAHGEPLVARFVWLPKQDRMLTANDLFANATAWNTISDYAREQLHAALSQRIDADELPPDERAETIRTVGRMIDEGTQPSAATFAAFEPIPAPAPDGERLMGLRFVFPPYQVGPYVDGVRTVDVPTEILSPLLVPQLKPLFVDVKPPQPAVPVDGDPAGPPQIAK